MNHQNVLEQAWRILRSYRRLWILGFALALTTCSWQGVSGLGARYDSGQKMTIKSERFNLIIPGFEGTIDLTPEEGFQIILPYDDGQPLVITYEDSWSVDVPPGLEQELGDVTRWLNGELPPDVSELVTGSIIIVVAVTAAIFLLATVVRYFADVALIRAVNDQVKTGQKASLGRLLGMGFSRAAWRFFLIDLVIRLPLLLLFLALVLLSLAPLSLWATGDASAGLFGVAAAGLLTAGVTLLAITINATLSVLIAFFRRACALEGLTALAAIGRGFRLLRHNLKDVAIMAAWVIAITIAWAILLIPVTLLIIPVVLAFVLLGGLVAVAILIALAGVASLVLNEVLALVLAGCIALVVFIPIVGAPFFFWSGLLHVYASTIWTLTYRQLRVEELVAPKAAAEIALEGV